MLALIEGCSVRASPRRSGRDNRSLCTQLGCRCMMSDFARSWPLDNSSGREKISHHATLCCVARVGVVGLIFTQESSEQRDSRGPGFRQCQPTTKNMELPLSDMSGRWDCGWSDSDVRRSLQLPTGSLAHVSSQILILERSPGWTILPMNGCFGPLRNRT